MTRPWFSTVASMGVWSSSALLIRVIPWMAKASTISFPFGVPLVMSPSLSSACNASISTSR